jgi:oligogalacturonide lyase
MLLGMCSGGSLAAAVWVDRKAQPVSIGSEFVRFADPTTETTVVRLTSPAHANVLPSATNRFISLKPRVLFCSSDRFGKMSPFEIDLRTGAIRRVAETNALDPSSLSLDGQARSLYFLDGGTLSEIAVGSRREPKRTTPLASDIVSFGIGASRTELFAIRGRQLLKLEGGASAVLADNAQAPCLVRPGGRGCLFSRSIAGDDREFWYVAANPGVTLTLLAKGRVSDPYWSSDGESVLFLRDVPKNDVFISEVREVKPEEGKERCVTKTSQFAAFAPNENDSVFVGASRSRAQPNIILLLRSAQRELTLCEHHSSNPAEVKPAFSPDSRRVYFQSDREGKPAIYSVNVEQLVEPTAI